MRADLATILKDAPAAIRRVMIEDAPNLTPGAAHVMGRFWTAVRVSKGNYLMPAADAYRAAAASESTFRCLLRALATYAPHVSTAPARIISDEWYARRCKPAARGARIKTTAPGENWPPAWRRMIPDLNASPIRPTTRKRYLASIDRCSALVAEGLASDKHGFITACELSDAFLFHPDETRRVKPVTAANYIEGLIALGAKGGVAKESLTAMQVITRDLRAQAALDEKNKYERISELMEQGGYAHVADKIREFRERAHALPAHSAARRRCMQQAVVCAVILNKPPRKGDLVSWRFGNQIVRDVDGTWRAEWDQEKTGGGAETGAIWPEVCEILDEWVLGGRPDRLVHLRYNELVGRNWLSFDETEPYRNLPTELTNAAIGVPSHDLRTLAADYMRRHNPAHAAGVIATHLGHADRKSTAPYRAECNGAAAQAIWQKSRATIAAQAESSAGKRKKRTGVKKSK